MNTPGIIACLLIILLVSASGCSVLSLPPEPAAKQSVSDESGLVETPTLPEQYVAQTVGTLTTESAGVVTPTFEVNQSLPLLSPAQLTTITGTNLSGEASNSSASNRTASIPVAQFTSNIVMGFAPLTVQFTDTSMNLPTAWAWNFGDGNFSTLQNPSNTYYAGGEYTVNFAAFNGLGGTVYTNTISVYSPGLSVNPDHGLHPLQVTFTDTGTGYPQPSAWYWDFGDIGAGNTSNQQNSTHQYISPGTYDVKLRITGPAGTAWVNRSAAVTVT